MKERIDFKYIAGAIDIIFSIGEAFLVTIFPEGAITFTGVIVLLKNVSSIYLENKSNKDIVDERKIKIEENLYNILREYIQTELSESSNHMIEKYIEMTMQSYITLDVNNIDKYSLSDICSKITEHVERLYPNTSPSNQKIISELVIYLFYVFLEAIKNEDRIRSQTRINMQFHKRVSELEEKSTDCEKEIKRNIKFCSDKFTEILYLHTNTNINLKNLFVDPIVMTHDNSCSESNELLDCFTSERFRDDKYIILFGAAGSGKTSIVYRLAYSYYVSDEKKEQLFNNKELVIIRLRYLSKSDIRDNGLYYAICRYLGVDINSNVFSDKYVILDGLDEISLNYDYSFYESILNKLITSFSDVYKLIITSRPGVFCEDKDHSKWHIYSILPFSDDKKGEWIKKYESLTGTTISQDIKDYILPSDKSGIASIFDYPQLMYMIAGAKPDADSWSLDNKWSIYHNIFYYEILNRNYENDKVDKPDIEVIEYIYDLLKKYSYTIYFNQSNIANTGKNIYQIRRDFFDSLSQNEEICKAVEKYGYRFGCYWKYDEDMVEIEFYHNNIRDFFIAEYIYDQLNIIFKTFPNKSYIIDGISTKDINEYDQLEEIAKKLYKTLGGIPISKEIVDFIESRTEFRLRDTCYGECKYHDEFADFICNNAVIDSNGEAIDAFNRGYLFTAFLELLFTNPIIISEEKNTTGYDTIHLIANFLNNFLTIIFSILKYSNNNKVPIFYWDTNGVISSAYIPTKYYRYINLEGANLSTVHLAEASLSRAILKDANLSFSSLFKCNLQDASLINANLENAHLTQSVLVEANLTGATLECAYLDNANLEEAILKNTNLDRANLISAILRDADLQESKLVNANLMGAKLTNANLRGAVLVNAILSVADLRGADLRGADLRGADLRGAYLNDVILEKTNFQGANLGNTVLEYSKIDGEKS